MLAHPDSGTRSHAESSVPDGDTDRAQHGLLDSGETPGGQRASQGASHQEVVR